MKNFIAELRGSSGGDVDDRNSRGTQRRWLMLLIPTDMPELPPLERKGEQSRAVLAHRVRLSAPCLTLVCVCLSVCICSLFSPLVSISQPTKTSLNSSFFLLVHDLFYLFDATVATASLLRVILSHVCSCGCAYNFRRLQLLIRKWLIFSCSLFVFGLHSVSRPCRRVILHLGPCRGAGALQ